MVSPNRIILPTAVALLLLAPFVGASAAHPHPHEYVGDAAHSVQFSAKQEGNKIKLNFESAVVGVCADAVPVVSQLFPPEPFRDGDADVGLGGACFAFQTPYGDDTGATLTVLVSDVVSSLRPAWVTCVDVNGDGLCTKDNDEYNFCVRTATGDVSLITGGACTIYANPAATLNPAIYVLIVGYVEAERDLTITSYAGAAGFIFVV